MWLYKLFSWIAYLTKLKKISFLVENDQKIMCNIVSLHLLEMLINNLYTAIA